MRAMFPEVSASLVQRTRATNIVAVTFVSFNLFTSDRGDGLVDGQTE
jgi:hypothetical protein